MRQFYDLNFLRAQTLILGPDLQVMHPMDETSSIYGTSRESLKQIEEKI
ncbi:MAG: hypothetical protein ACTMUB_00275 [cyanobacterium endosymbiont of Rhopalodia musculus]|nr:hypothetical protein [cyanobacterium endosymbiont of Epithemia clementina EcSB]WGT66725.1 hypothetical protein P3F56_05510 [cyanobacterium endosymbiont of Epithemia clementina EcSB]